MMMSACKSDSFVSRGWRNFTAYYNTFYNAQNLFKKAEEKIEDQIRSQTLKTERPIRIYPTPVNAAEQDLDKVIQKGAQILREHSDSKWADNALLLIGESYFYQQKYFSAEQKFREIYNASPDPRMRQFAVFWNGRVMLEMERYREGIEYINDRLNDTSLEWTDQSKQPAKAVLSELYTAEEMYTEAVSSLRDAPPYLDDRDTRGRAYFLLGQLLDKQEQWHQAFAAFGLVPQTAEYELVYWADRKRAEMARKVGQPDLAYEILEDMRKDDKNLDRLPSIWYELGRTEQERDNVTEAKEYFHRVLRRNSRQFQTDEVTKSKAYYSLGMLYQTMEQNFSLAAAYYDSAATKRLDPEERPDWYNAETKAEAFGAYDRLSNNIQRMDSLLWLGNLPEAKFDSVLAVVRQQKREALQQRLEDQQQQANTLVNVSETEQQTTTGSQDSESGFLNINDRAKVANSAQQFRALWGNRPLVDQWRRREAIQASGAISDAENGGRTAGQSGQDQTFEGAVTVDISEVPFSEEAQVSMRHKKAEATYELGNVFFISLELYDSAAVRYQQVIAESRDSLLVPQAMFSLSEVQLAQQDTARALNTARKLLEQYPQSDFAQRVVRRYEWANLGQAVATESSEVDEALQQYRDLSTGMDGLQEEEYQARAEVLRSLAEAQQKASFAPLAQFDAVSLYMKLGKQLDYYQSHVDDWFTHKMKWKQRESEFQSLQDSLKSALNDTTTTFTDSLKAHYRTVIDSSLKAPDFTSDFPYVGAPWDSSRVILDTMNVRYIQAGSDSEMPKLSARMKAKVQQLRVELKLPEALIQEASQQDSNRVYSCDSLGVELQMADSLQNFASRIQYPESLKGMTLSGEVQFVITVDPEGKVIEVKTVDRSSNLGLEEAIMAALKEQARFKPVMVQNKPVTAQCGYTVPIRLDASR
jgi:TonB family protein